MGKSYSKNKSILAYKSSWTYPFALKKPYQKLIYKSLQLNKLSRVYMLKSESKIQSTSFNLMLVHFHSKKNVRNNSTTCSIAPGVMAWPSFCLCLLGPQEKLKIIRLTISNSICLQTLSVLFSDTCEPLVIY